MNPLNLERKPDDIKGSGRIQILDNLRQSLHSARAFDIVGLARKTYKALGMRLEPPLLIR